MRLDILRKRLTKLARRSSIREINEMDFKNLSPYWLDIVWSVFEVEFAMDGYMSARMVNVVKAILTFGDEPGLFPENKLSAALKDDVCNLKLFWEKVSGWGERISGRLTQADFITYFSLFGIRGKGEFGSVETTFSLFLKE